VAPKQHQATRTTLVHPQSEINMHTKDNQDTIKSYLKLMRCAADKLTATLEDSARQSHAHCVYMLSKNSPDYEVSPYWAKRKFELEMIYPELFTQPANHINPITKE
jgi:hypothetical protein